MATGACTSRFVDELQHFAQGLEIDCWKLKQGIERRPHEGFGRELLHRIERDTASVSRTVQQVQQNTFADGSLSAMLAAALQFHAESEAQLGQVEVALEQYGYVPVGRTTQQQELGSPAGPEPGIAHKIACVEVDVPKHHKDKENKPSESGNGKTAADDPGSPGALDTKTSNDVEILSDKMEPQAPDELPEHTSRQQPGKTAAQPEEPFLSDPFSPQPSVGSAPSFRWSSPPPRPALEGKSTAAAGYEGVDDPATPTMEDFGLDPKRYGLSSEASPVATSTLSPMEKVLRRASAGPTR